MENFTKDFSDNEKVKQSYERNAEGVNSKINQELKNKLVISLCGSVNAGKSSAMNALLGRKISEVNPLPGWTKEINIHPYSNEVFIADTPGLLDVNFNVSAITKDFIQKEADLILFFVCVDPGLSAPVFGCFKEVADLKKEMLGVLTKIDYYVDEREQLKSIINNVQSELNQYRDKTNVIPISSTKKINIDLLQQEILKILDEKGKDLLFAKMNHDKWPAVHHYILNSCGEIAGLTLIQYEINLDKITEIQLELVKKIACVYDVPVTSADLVHFLTDLCSRDLSFALFQKAYEWLQPFVSKIPFINKGVNIAIPAAVTYGIGYTAHAYYGSGMKKKADELETIFRTKVMEYSTSDIDNVKDWIRSKISNLFISFIM